MTASARNFIRDLLDLGRARLAGAVALVLLGALLEGLGLALLVPLFSVLTGAGEDGPFRSGLRDLLGRVGLGSDAGRLAALLALFAAVVVARALVLYLRDTRLFGLQLDLVERLRVRLIRAIAEARWSDVAALRHARVTSALTIELQRVSTLSQTLLQSVVAVAMLSSQILVAATLAPAVGLSALALVVAAGAWVARRLQRSAGHGHRMGRHHLAMVERASELLGGLKAAAAENGQRRFVAAFAAAAAELGAAQLAHQSRLARLRMTLGIGAALLCAAALSVGYALEGAGPALLAAIAIATRMAGPATQLQRNAELIAANLPAHAELTWLLRELPPGEPPVVASTASLDGALTLRNVSHVRPNGTGLRGVSVRIDRGEIVGVVGPSGAGKTSFVDVLAGLLRPDGGEMLVGDVPLDAATSGAWRDGVAYVGQEAYLLHDTVRRNLLPAGGADEPALWWALEQAAAADLVRAMPDGLETVVGERGGRLSGGERQRIALARALLRRPRLLLLDEATNALDVETEAAVLDRLAALDPRPAIIVVAHRRETLRRCDRILTIVDGHLRSDAPA